MNTENQKTRHPIIVDIGGNLENRFGYDFQAQKVYIKNNENRQSVASKAAGAGGISGTILYGALYHFYNMILPLYWLILSTISFFVLMFVLVKLGVFWVEHFENFKKFVKIELSDFKDLQTVKDLNNERSGIIFFVVFAIVGIVIALPLGNAYVTTSDMTLWMMYILTIFLANIGIYACWYANRGKKFRKLALEQLKTKETTQDYLEVKNQKVKIDS